MNSTSPRTILALCTIAALYCVVSEMDYRDAVARETAVREHRNWVARNYIPQKPATRGIIEMRHDGSTSCAMYENAEFGSAPRLMFAEVRR